MKTALIAGASGLIGKQLTYMLLEQKEYLKVIIMVRQELTIKHHKLEQRVVSYDHLRRDLEGLEADDVFCCLGTTMRKAGTRENFRKVDFQYVVDFAKLCKQKGIKNFYLVSALGADAQSSLFYNRVKAETEAEVQQIGFERLYIFRPSLLLGDRYELRLAEKVGGLVARALSPLMLGSLRKYRPIKAVDVARAMMRAALEGETGNFVLESDQIRRLAG